MSRKSRMSQMSGGSLIPPQTVAVEQGHLEMLSQSHIKIDSRYFAIDPNLDFESSTILCEDRVYPCDQTPSATAPITFTIQPQFNVFRSLSESRFVFTVKVVPPTIGTTLQNLQVIPKPYWSQLFVRDFTCNINNVACNDQHSRVAPYAGFIKILLTQGNLKTSNFNLVPTSVGFVGTISLNSMACDDTRTLQEGIINLDVWNGEDFLFGYNNVVMQSITGGSLSGFGTTSYFNATTGYNIPPITLTTLISIELTYRPQDGIFLQPKLLPPGVNLNYIFNTNTLGFWANGYNNSNLGDGVYSSANPDLTRNVVGGDVFTYQILKAQYYERQYTITQTGLKAYQSLIMRQPLYYSCMTSNTLLYQVDANAPSVQLTNIFSGRLPNIVVVGLLNQTPSSWVYNTTIPGNSYPLLTYSPQPPAGLLQTIVPPALPTNLPLDCINSVLLTANGRTYPHMWSSNMLPGSTQDISIWYEQYRQCALISALNGRDTDQSNINYDPKYKYDNPILTKAEFASSCTFFCFNIRRNGTILNCSGDKEVGGIDLLVNINGTSHPNAQLLVVGLSTDSLATITDGGATTSFVF
jgi:hypothetical protein